MANAVLFDILNQIKLEILGLSLAGMSNSNVVVMRRVTSKVADLLPSPVYPFIAVSPWGRESLDMVANTDDDWGYPVGVVMVEGNASADIQAGDSQRDGLNRFLLWRETIKRHFSGQELIDATTAVKLAWQIKVEPLEIVDSQAWDKYGLSASGLVLRCYSRESHG